MKRRISTKKQPKLTEAILSLHKDIECEHFEINNIDFSIPDNRIKWFPFGKILRAREIDQMVGRNTILALLRFYGILDKRNKPVKEWMLNFCFKIIIIKHPEQKKFYSEYTFISGQGISVTRELIRNLRKGGASL